MWELLSQNKLKEHLDEKEQRALRMVDQLKQKHGQSEEEARDQAIHALLAPPEGRAILEEPPPQPIQGKEREAIYTRLEALGRAEDRREKKDFKKDHHGLI